ncbi:metallophosphoesterase [Schinkia azotoformans]|uniref:Calcineurin-like phosphoesterase domain-containing protein n=1 Tax=Schinkia azotoformans LMG 9581 TaxID=1131731 RepID=K6D713_SCHAZ|nr:metallophosphoesterase [Schinkia azotoformans]EKN68322.1 hypothetical protein BAZO_04750 [Schinkia azotoformans LMG 9581]MEC1638564.1 metallophosphoesterase [Schinkia azotoformans]MEC1946001.1 metallophosphoesterase [Schinkia azotoformans]
MTLLNNWLDANQPDVFIISGDMTAGPEKSLNLLNQLQNSNLQIKIIFVHGNHDVYYGDSTQAYEILLKFPGNLGNGPIKLDDNWVVIGEGGWYDYTFGMKDYNAEHYALGTFGNFTWPDKTYANWPMDDQNLTDYYVEKIEKWLQEYEGKNIIMVTHYEGKNIIMVTHYEGIEIICNPLGYYPHEWNHSSPEKEIHSTIKVIVI